MPIVLVHNIVNGFILERLRGQTARARTRQLNRLKCELTRQNPFRHRLRTPIGRQTNGIRVKINYAQFTSILIVPFTLIWTRMLR